MNPTLETKPSTQSDLDVDPVEQKMQEAASAFPEARFDLSKVERAGATAVATEAVVVPVPEATPDKSQTPAAPLSV